MTQGIVEMTRNILNKTIESGLSAQIDLKRVMAKLLGERIISKQEMLHLILYLLMVSCSHEFFRVNLDVECIEVNISSNPIIEGSENNILNSNNNRKNDINESPIPIKSIIDMNSNVMMQKNCINDQACESNVSDLETMNFIYF